MKSFKTYLREQFLLEYKEWHQFIKHNGDSILDKIGLAGEYASLSSEPGHGTPEHKTNYINGKLSMSQEHGRWVLDQLLKDNIPNIEDITTSIHTNLKKFDQLKSEGKIETNLKKVQHPTDLFNIVSKHDTKTMDQRHGLERGKDYSVLGENEHWTVYQPHTHKAACGLGSNTNWCTTSGAFESYNKEGPLHIFIPKKPAYPGEKYQYHEQKDQFMDEKDRPIYSRADASKEGAEKIGPRFGSRPSPLGTKHSSSLHDLMSDPNTSHEKIKETLSDPFVPAKILDKSLKSPHLEIQRAVVQHPKFGTKKTHIFDAIRSPHLEIVRAGLQHPDFGTNPFDMSYTLKSPHLEIARAAVQHPNFGISVGDISDALSSPHPEIQRAAVQHPNFGKGEFHFSDAISSKNLEIQRAAVQHPDFGKSGSGIIAALNSPHLEIARAAVQHPDFGTNEYHLFHALKSPHLEIARAAVQHPKFRIDKNNISGALLSPHLEIAKAAVQHPDFGKSSFHKIFGLKSPHLEIQRAASGLK